MSAITTHILDTALGRPAAGVPVCSTAAPTTASGRRSAAATPTTTAGCARCIPGNDPPAPGVYRLTFDTQRYFESLDVDAFYPEVVVVFETLAGETHYHVPLLLGPFGFTTYRGT